MKMSDISQKLTEQPGGFGGKIKAKLQSQIPFARRQQRAGKAKIALYKKARAIKKELQAWRKEEFRSTGGTKIPITMSQFLGWVKKSQPKYAKGIEDYARGDKAYADYFAQRMNKGVKQSSTASDSKINVDSEQADPDKINKDVEEEAAEFEKQDLKASKDEDKKPKVDTSASIYEARLKAILEADEEVDADVGSDEDVGVNRIKTLRDNQIDTLITMGIEKQIELDGGESIVDDPKELSSKGAAEPAAQGGSGEASDGFLSEYQDELESVLTKVVQGADLDKRDQRNASAMLNSL